MQGPSVLVEPEPLGENQAGESARRMETSPTATSPKFRVKIPLAHCKYGHRRARVGYEAS